MNRLGRGAVAKGAMACALVIFDVHDRASMAQTDAAPPPKAGQEQVMQRRQRPGNLIGHGGPIKAIALGEHGRLVATGSFDYSVMVWDVSSDAPKLLRRLDAHGAAVNAVAFLPVVPGQDVRLLAAADDGVVTLWNVTSGAALQRFIGHQGKVTGVAISDDGRFGVSAGWDRTARVWDLVSLSAGPLLQGHKGPVNAAVFSADGATVYTASYDGTIGVYERATGLAQAPLVNNGWGINVLQRLPGSEVLAFGALNGSVGIVDVLGRQPLVELKGHDRPVLALAVIEKPGLIATGGGDGIVRVMRLSDGAVLEEFKNPFGPVWALLFMADGTKMYLGGLDDFATFWQVAPRAPFEPADGEFPRRFQQSGKADTQLGVGELQFARKCSVCHTLTQDGANRAGPTLHQIFGRRIAALPGYPYSEPLKRLDFVWTEESIAKLFELGPDVVTPGSKMPLQLVTDKYLRDALIAYLKVSTGSANGLQKNQGEIK